YRIQGRNEEARTAFAKAIAADNRVARPYLLMAFLAVSASRWQEAVDNTERAIHLNPLSYPQAFVVNALAYYPLRNLPAAEKSAREAVSLDRTHRYPIAQQVLGLVLWMQRDLRGAAENLRAYLKYAPEAPDADAVRNELAQVEARLHRAESARTGTP